MSRTAAASPEQLRVAYVWCDEVMADAVVAPSTSVTVGPDPGCMFVTPELGLPPAFALLRGDGGGHVVTLRQGMSGRICLAGRTAEVAELADDSGDHFTSAVEPGDWGVIELDGTGDHNLFFQFVPTGPPLPLARSRFDELLAPALAFAVILHAILLTITYLLQDDQNRLLFPGSRDLMTGYLVKRPPPAPPQEELPTVEVGVETTDEKPTAVAKKDRTERRPRPSRAPRAGDPAVPQKVLDAGLLKHRDAITDLGNRGFDKDLTKALSRLQDRTASGPGPGRPGGGDGEGPGGGTRGDPSGVEGGGREVVDTGDIDTGGERSGAGDRRTKPREVSVQIGSGTPTGDLGEITETEIDNVVKSRTGLYRSCYQKQLNRSPNLAGKLVVRFHITADGKVKSAKVVRDKSTLQNATVEDCVLRHIQRLAFPAKGGALVNYPLFFSQG